MLGPWVKVNWKWSNRRWQEWTCHFRSQWTKVEISELKWTGMGKFNSDDHIYYCGQECLRRNGVALIVNKKGWNAILRYNLKNDRMISVHFQGKPFNITVIIVYAPTTCCLDYYTIILIDYSVYIENQSIFEIQVWFIFFNANMVIYSHAQDPPQVRQLKESRFSFPPYLIQCHV